MERRGFLKRSLLWFLGIFSVGVLAETLVVMYRFLMPSRKRIPLKTFASFSTDILQGEAKEIQLRGGKIILINNEGAIMAFSATCPHLGCSVKWNPNRKEFLCPCHLAAFGKNGQVLNGPPPRPMDQYRVLKEGNIVFVFVPDNYLSRQEM